MTSYRNKRKVFAIPIIKWLAITFANFYSVHAAADFLAGDASVATLSPDGVRKNPANFAFISNGYFDMSPKVFEINSLMVRYPGFSTVPKEIRGISPMSALSFAPFNVDANKNKFGFVLTEILPPIEVPLEMKQLPLYFLDQLMFLNVKVKAQIRFGLGGAIAYRASDRLGFGLSSAFRSIGLHSTLKAPENNAELAGIKTDLTTFNVNFGFRYVVVPGRLAIGFLTTLVSLTEIKNSLDGGFSEFAGNAASDESESAPALQFAKMIIGGFHFMATSKLSLRADIEYRLAVQDEKRFSIVDLQEQTVDNYDTISVRIGSKLALSQRNALTVGFVYEPASIGPGERGKDTTTGFGTIDFIPIYAGFDDLKPYQRFVCGFARSFGRTKGFDRWTTAGGLAYQQSSLGIDQDGELPGAYRQKKIIFPLQVTYRY